jgi:hypothetical protein
MPSGGRVNCGVSTLRVLARLQHNDVLRAKVARANRAGQASSWKFWVDQLGDCDPDWLPMTPCGVGLYDRGGDYREIVLR